MQITLINRAIKNIVFENDVYGSDPNIEIKLEAKQDTRVDFDYANKKLACTLSMRMAEVAEKPRVVLNFDMVGLFLCDEVISNENRAELHILSCQKLFPYLVEAIASITCKSGMQPIILPPMNITNKDITIVSE